MPEKTVVQINADSLAYSAGVFHCITMHIPANAGGDDPVAYLESPAGGTYDPGDVVPVRWRSDDDDVFGNRTVDVLLSVDGGASFEPVVSGTADDGVWNWVVPDVDTDQAVLRVRVIDADGNSGFDDSEGIVIEGTGVPGDASGDGFVGVDDLLIVIAGWNCTGTGCPGDVDGDQFVGVDDLLAVIANWGGGAP